MAQSANVSVQNNFIKGFITEATGLTFPENASNDTENCVFDHLGGVERRLGIDLESQHVPTLLTLGEEVINTFLWTNVSGNGDQTFVVVQTGTTLRFYRVASESSLGGGLHADTIDLNDFAVPGDTDIARIECQYSTGNGVLFVTNRRLETFYVTYDNDADTFVPTVIDIQIRDFEGDTADTTDITSRPVGNSTAHYYNLKNQGWTDANIADWDAARADFPSNADVAWYFKNVDDEFDFTTVDDRAVGNSKAPSGHYLYSVYNFNRSANVPGATDFEIALERVTTSAFFAGRVFYAGIKEATHSSRIYFTQVIETPTQYSKCHQANDPTSEQLFDLLPTDGGMIDIIEAGTVIKMVPVLNALVVFASNGIWTITGSQGVGFAATDYSINKLSSLATVSHTSFVIVDGVPFWWALDGIYNISLDKQTNAFKVVSVTDTTIKQYFQDIPAASKLYARGAYDTYLKRVQWIFRSEAVDNFAQRYQFDRILNLNMLTGAFFYWTSDLGTVKINSILNVVGVSGVLVEEEVVSGIEPVLDGAEEVVAFVSTGQTANTAIKYFVSYTLGVNSWVNWAEIWRDTLTDWATVISGGQPFNSYFAAGYMVRGKGMNKFQDNYINIFSRSLTSSSFLLNSQWDYSFNPANGRWSNSQLVIVDGQDGFTYKKKRLRLRGHGLACQFRIFNNDQNPFYIIGWAIEETGNQKS